MSGIGKIIRDILYGNAFTALLRILPGILFLYSGLFKVLDPRTFSLVVMKYGLLPEVIVPYFSIILPFLELLLGVFLVAGFRVRAAAFLSMILMVLFMAAVGYNIIRGESFDCGCFELGHFGISENIGAGVIIRDAVFFMIFLLVFNAKRHHLSLDSVIERRDLSEL